ncbi:MAG: hypothetical protein KKD86_02640 [Bacteroidetes bacterium]|nr:hypothetical protein [Bacteroidota bacterium]
MLFNINSYSSVPMFLFLLLIGISQVHSTELKEIEYFCTSDSSFQNAMFYNPSTSSAVPLLVGLHQWSSDYTSYHGPIYYER